MKQRITYLVPDPESFDPDLLTVNEASLSLRDVKAAKEHRLTFGLSELPAELRKAFDGWHELHIRWATDSPYTALPPFTSRVSPGLHVSFTPQEEQQKSTLCPFLKDAFGDSVGCDSTNGTFIQPPILAERFSMSASSEFFAHIPSMSPLVSYIQERICPSSSTICKDAADSLLSASYVDIDYDAISHALVFNVFWAQPSDKSPWTEKILLPGTEETIEVGILSIESNPDPDILGFSGFLTVLGQDDTPKPTRFQAPSRHHPLPSSLRQTFTASFNQPTGLHPTLTISLPPTDLRPPERTCKLHTYLTLPSYLFIDKYQFTDPLFLSSHHLKNLRTISGATDLEAPDWVVKEWGSTALFELDIPSSQDDKTKATEREREWNISIPLHLRYLPASNSSHTRVPVPWPVVFWACRAEEGTKMNVNPFDRRHLGYEGLFGPKTKFIDVPPARQDRLVEFIDVPVLDLRRTGWVEMGTMGVVLLAFLWLSWVLFGPVQGKVQKGEGKGKKTQ
ncbi:PIG-X-domain-containing protein [Lophiostoma macrostomum CBS 122681]|uniref:Protein PBN1 n=1 Tax=Lophiostoma macrostomum CBS 122681 TaxID=1314788 RepID=A0A6A6T0M5_9PLEO|nr:PIG-X-domain-containing protein [Lophiostoma macrostomum CBS 122681]